MNILRTMSIVSVAAIIAACSSAPNKPAPVAAPVVPAVTDISGKWLLTVQSPGGSVDGDMTITQSGTDIKGTIESSMGNVDLTGSVNGKNVKFTYRLEKLGLPAGTIFEYSGSTDDGTMKGTATFATFGEGEWTAKRL